MSHPKLATERAVHPTLRWPDTRCQLAVEERPLLKETRQPDAALSVLSAGLYPPVLLGGTIVNIGTN